MSDSDIWNFEVSIRNGNYTLEQVKGSKTAMEADVPVNAPYEKGLEAIKEMREAIDSEIINLDIEIKKYR